MNADNAPDHVLAADFVAEWLPNARLTPLDAMNSSTWLVEAGDERYVLKIADPDNEPGLRAASCLDERGMPTGAPVRMAHRDGRLLALLQFVDGTPLDAADAETVGTALGRAHRLLQECEPPAAMDRWPWAWLDTGLIADRELREASSSAVERAVAIGPTVTHGILHADPAPEAFLATETGVALIDWGASCHGPLLYDVASAVMYAGDRVLAGYRDAGPLSPGELRHVDAFLAFRWALQAWYFSKRTLSGDLTGIDDPKGNQDGLDDARAGLLGS